MNARKDPRHYISASTIERAVSYSGKVAHDPRIETATRRVMAHVDTTPKGLKEAFDRTFEQLREST